MTDALKMAREALPAISPHDHPEHHSMVWTEREIAWIKDYAARSVVAAIDAQQAATVGADIAALVDAYGAAMADKGRTGQTSAIAYARWARSNLMDALAGTPPAVQAPTPLTDEQIDAVFMQHAGQNEWGLPYLRTYREGFRHIARAVLAAAGAAAQGASMSSDLPEPAEAVTDADEWLRQRFGGARSHPEWRTLVEAFNAGRAAPAAPAGAPAPAEAVAWPMTEDEARSAFWGCYPHSGDGDKSEVWMTAYRWCRLKITKTYRAAPAAPAGWQWVPKEPTQEMRNAFHAVGESQRLAFGNAGAHWKAMLAAAPGAPQGDAAGNVRAKPPKVGLSEGLGVFVRSGRNTEC